MVHLYEDKTRITYYDLDFRGKVKLSALLRMVHIAADINANHLKVGYRDLSQYDMSFVLQRFSVKASRMPAYDQVVTIRTWPGEVSKGTFIRKGDMYSQSGEKLLEWASMWLLFDIKARKVLRPQALPVQIPQITDMPVEIMPEKVVLPDITGIAPISEHSHVVRYAEIDTNMHMNNSIYGDLVGNSIFATLEPDNYTDWGQVHINFLGEVFPGEEIQIASYTDGVNSFVKGDAPGRASFTAKVIW